MPNGPVQILCYLQLPLGKLLFGLIILMHHALYPFYWLLLTCTLFCTKAAK
jgi:hypothetical protein